MSFERGTLSANVMSRGEKKFCCKTLRGHNRALLVFISIQKCSTSKQWGNLVSKNKKPIKKLLVLGADLSFL